MRTRLIFLFFLTSVVPWSGCATSATHTELMSFLKAHENKVSATEYRVEPPDAIEVSAPRVAEIDGEKQVIQPDGKISLRLIGEVKVAGLTAREIASRLEKLLGPYYTDPKVRVRVLNRASKRYYVLGQVESPGPRAITGRDTLLHALAVSRPTHIGWASRVKVIRPAPVESDRRIVEIDVDAMYKTGDTHMNILLEPGDVVYVPPTPLGWIGLRMQELLFPVAPVARAYEMPSEFITAYDQVNRNNRG